MLPPLAVGGLTAAAVLVVGSVDPHRPGSYGVCPVYALTGMLCAGCGGLRATHDLAHGDLAGAWAMNPLWVLLVPVLVAAWATWLARRWRGVPDPAPGPAGPAGAARTTRRAAPGVLLVVVLVYSVARNVPALAPWLAP
ncbi:DUF2752 domain-containing protein [Cellulomonas sp. NS3]|uniref:DUF2752 domain-containing protein n=1 Tax=Cellulomonas sp. NS3 TaxID=2973977 RepID=UPI002161FB43|nr:DUF2752 domain-containing protein [Cellulomonas sp. NS3]